MVNGRKLKAKIIEKGLSMTRFAEAIGVSRNSLTYKISGKVDWSREQIGKAIEILELSPADITSIFFDSSLSNMTKGE